MIRLWLCSVQNEEWHTTKKTKKGMGWAVALLVKEKAACIWSGGGDSNSAMSVVCTLSVCADFITAPEGENSNRPLLHLMPGPYIIRVHILMLWTGAWEQISVRDKWHFTLHQLAEARYKLEIRRPCFSHFSQHIKRQWVTLTTAEQ